MPSCLLSEGPRRLQGGSTTQFCVSTFLTLDKAAQPAPLLGPFWGWEHSLQGLQPRGREQAPWP